MNKKKNDFEMISEGYKRKYGQTIRKTLFDTLCCIILLAGAALVLMAYGGILTLLKPVIMKIWIFRTMIKVIIVLCGLCFGFLVIIGRLTDEEYEICRKKTMIFTFLINKKCFSCPA